MRQCSSPGAQNVEHCLSGRRGRRARATLPGVDNSTGGVASNSFACLHGLTEDVRKRGLLGEVEVRTHAIDESVRRIPLDEIARRNRAPGCRALACLVGVQTKRARTAAVRHCRLGVGSAYGAAESHDWPLICARGG